MRVSTRLAVAVVVAAVVGGVAAFASAQTPPAARTKAQFAGGFHPDACRYPREARRKGVSACCIMDLEINSEGRVLKSDGTCTDPSFLLPTQRCLTAQSFIPATENGRPVQTKQSFEYEWRSWDGNDKNLCTPLKTS